MQDNLKKKYGITDQELKRAVDQIKFGKIACDRIVLVALVDLISNGDIKSETDNKDVAKEILLEIKVLLEGYVDTRTNETLYSRLCNKYGIKEEK